MTLHRSRILIFVVGFVIAFAIGIATSAEAASKHKKRHAAAAAAGAMQAAGPMSAPPWGGGAQGTGPLYFGQEYLGTDPDPGIRFQLMRDITGRYGGGGD